MSYPGHRARRSHPGQRSGQRRRISPNLVIEPLIPEHGIRSQIAHSPNRTGFKTYDALAPMHVSRAVSPQKTTLYGTEIEESRPLLSSGPLLADISHSTVGRPPSLGRAVHRVNFPGGTAVSRPRQRYATQSAHRLSRLGVIRNENPAKDLASPCCSHGCCCVQCVRTTEVGVLQRFGQFQRLLDPGLHCIMWPCTRIPGRLTLRVQQLTVRCETKTKDNVFVHVSVTTLFRVIVDRSYDAFYRLTDPRLQIKSYVFDVVRSTIPRMSVDDVFVSKSDVAIDILRRLQGTMHQYGYEIIESLITDISPDPHVKDSMNEINASKRLKQAMPHKAEAEKIKKIKAAESEAETHYLRGVGVARERQAIAKGLKESVVNFSAGGIGPKDVMDLLVLSQYLDTLVAVGANKVILPHDPGQAVFLKEQLSEYFVAEKGTNSGAEGIPDLLL